MMLLDLPIPEAGWKLRDGTLSSVRLAQAHLDRIATHDPVYRSFVTLMGDQALAEAARADEDLAKGLDRGPLHGIPVALKDVIDVEGIPTTCCSRLRDGHVASEDAAIVKRLRAAGAVILGKLATYEFGIVGPSFDLPQPPARNPWNAEHITGGSSSGCAAAVASGLVRTTLGTDTGGSVRSPAGYCGVVGLKPTFGRVSRQGIYPLSGSLDHVGPISATVAEAALTLDVAAGYDPADPASSSVGSSPAASLLGRDVGGLRVAYARDWFARDPEITHGVLSAMDDAVSQLTLLGIHIEEVSLPDYALFESCGTVILHAEALEVHRESIRARPRDYGRLAFQSLASGICLSPADVALAKRAGVQLSETLGGVFSRFEALVTVNTLTTAPLFSAFHRGAAVWTPMRTLPFNLTGHPALVVPAGLSGGLPVSLQIVGQHFDEAQVCRIGEAFEKSTDHSVLRPPEISRVPEKTYSESA